jgi:hypothetical protein
MTTDDDRPERHPTMRVALPDWHLWWMRRWVGPTFAYPTVPDRAIGARASCHPPGVWWRVTTTGLWRPPSCQRLLRTRADAVDWNACR